MSLLFASFPFSFATLGKVGLEDGDFVGIQSFPAFFGMLSRVGNGYFVAI